MACRRNIVFQALTQIYNDRLVATYSQEVDVTRSISDNIAGQAPETTPTARIIEGVSRLLGDKANVYGQMEVDATLECRIASTVDNRGLPQDKINDLEDALDSLFDPPVVILGVGQVIVTPNGDRTSNPGFSEAFLSYPIRVRFDRAVGDLEVVNG